MPTLQNPIRHYAEEKLVGMFSVPITVDNYFDARNAAVGRLAGDDVRRLVIPDAVVDVRVVGFLLPARMFAVVGFDSEPLRSGLHVVRLTILGRDCAVTATPISDDRPATVGHVPLTMLDWVVDPLGQRLIGNPEHGGQWMTDAYAVGRRPSRPVLL